MSMYTFGLATQHFDHTLYFLYCNSNTLLLKRYASFIMLYTNEIPPSVIL